MSARIVSYVGTDPRTGETWARVALEVDGVEHAEKHVSVRVQPDRDEEAAMAFAKMLYGELHTPRAWSAGGLA